MRLAQRIRCSIRTLIRITLLQNRAVKTAIGLQEFWPNASQTGKNFYDIDTVADFWNFLTPFANVVLSNSFPDQPGFFYRYFRILGLVRLRQVRVQKVKASTHTHKHSLTRAHKNNHTHTHTHTHTQNTHATHTHTHTHAHSIKFSAISEASARRSLQAFLNFGMCTSDMNFLVCRIRAKYQKSCHHMSTIATLRFQMK